MALPSIFSPNYKPVDRSSVLDQPEHPTLADIIGTTGSVLGESLKDPSTYIPALYSPEAEGAGPSPSAIARLLKILSPVRPAPLRMASSLPEIAQTLKGGKQPVSQLIQQLSGRPKVQQSTLQSVFGHVDPTQKMTPPEFASSAKSPKLFAQRGITSDVINEDLMLDLVTDRMYSPEMVDSRNLHWEHLIKKDILNYPELSTRDKALIQNLLAQKKAMSPELWETQAERVIANFDGPDAAHDSLMNSHVLDEARAWAYGEGTKATKHMDPAYTDYQRLGPTASSKLTKQELREFDANSGYFETVLRGKPVPRDTPFIGAHNTPEDYHFQNPSQLGHIRGSVSPDNRVYLEELQSDPLEQLSTKDVPELQDIYGKLGRMAIDRSAAGDATSVMFPTGNRIGDVRPKKQLPFYQDVYDKQLDKQLYQPLQNKGVPLTQGNGWTNIELTPALKEAIDNGLLNYNKGGQVKDVPITHYIPWKPK